VYTSQHMCRKYTAFVISLYVALCNIVWLRRWGNVSEPTVAQDVVDTPGLQ